jgi:hypothetical protein
VNILILMLFYFLDQDEEEKNYVLDIT